MDDPIEDILSQHDDGERKGVTRKEQLRGPGSPSELPAGAKDTSPQ